MTRRTVTADSPAPAEDPGKARQAEHVRRIVDAAPPLTDGQLDRLGSILRPVPRNGAA